jgi:hypothetical protein
MDLATARDHIGDPVIYHRPEKPDEHGVIASVNDHFVFVRYADGRVTTLATPPEALELAPELQEG